MGKSDTIQFPRISLTGTLHQSRPHVVDSKCGSVRGDDYSNQVSLHVKQRRYWAIETQLTVPADYAVNFNRNIVFSLDGLTGNGSELDLNI